jgi:hypothetical protein
MTQPTADDVLMMSGLAPTAWNFGEVPGSAIEGRVVAKPRSYHAREYDPSGQNLGKPKFFPSGDAVWGIAIDIQTTTRTGPEDSGVRRLYADKARLLSAIRDAVTKADRLGIEVGGYLKVVWTGTEMGKGNMPANTYEAYYTPPGAQVPIPVAPQHVSPQVMQHQPMTQSTSQAPSTHMTQPNGQVITATVAATLANAGVDLSAYTIIPG